MVNAEPATMFERSPVKRADCPNVLVVTNMYPHPAKPYMGIFVKEQVDSLRELGLNVDVLFINGPAKRINYLKGIISFWKRILQQRYDIIHAHYIYAGVIARLQVRRPVIITFHSGEFYSGPLEYLLSYFIATRVAGVILVCSRLKQFLSCHEAWTIPCGVDVHRFHPMPQQEAREQLGLPMGKNLVLFAAAKRPEKRFDLVEQAMNILKTQVADLELITVSQEPPERIPLYMNACDVLVLASDKEGSPQVVKEAMACNLPIVAVPVGDIAELISNIDGCHLCGQTPEDIAAKLKIALECGGRTNGAGPAARLSLERVAQRIMDVYLAAGIRKRYTTGT